MEPSKQQYEDPGPELSIVRRDRSEVETIAEMPLLTQEQIDRAEKAVEQVKRVKNIALSVTSEFDWRDMGGRPYLEASGVFKVARLFGISFVDVGVNDKTSQIDGRTIITYTAHVTAAFNGGTIEEIGIATSDDDFFSKKKGVRLPLSEIDLASVQKKALTNAQSRALKKILGLGGLSWDDIKAAKVDRGKVGAVDYDKGKPAGSATEGGRGSMASSAKIRLRNMLADLAAWNDTNETDLLRYYTEFKGKDGNPTSASSIDRMSDKWAAATLPKVERDWNAAQGQGAQREPGEEG